MRIGFLAALALACLVAGGTCLPLVDNVSREPTSGASIGAAIVTPSEDEAVRQGDPVSVEWSASNLSGQTATVSILAESRSDPTLPRTTLSQFALSGTGDSGRLTWDTTDFAGTYAVVARIAAAGESSENIGAGLVTVDAPPTFEFTSPAEDVTYEQGDSLAISWTGGDNDATLRIGLDPDASHLIPAEDGDTADGQEDDADADGDADADDGAANELQSEVDNEIFILERALPATSQADSFTWDGNDQEGNAVALGTYYLFAVITDGVNEDVIVDALGLVNVVEAGEDDADAEGLAVLQPADDVDMLPGESVDIEYQVEQPLDVLVDVKLDTDDNHGNSSWITIRSQEFVAEGETPDVWAWDGTDVDGNDVPAGIYRVYVVASDGTEESGPAFAQANGLIHRRDTADQPLIAILQPSDAQTVGRGDTVIFRWRDDDPGGEATIRLTIDDDQNPGEGEVDSDDDLAEVEILDGREADPDDVRDSYTWQVLGTLPPGTYYVFAYIDGDGDGDAEHTAVGPEPIIITDPANP